MAQLFDVIFADLRASRKSVNRLISTGLLFALVGHFYVVEPYFAYKQQERVVADQAKRGEVQIAELSRSLARITKLRDTSHQTLETIRGKIAGFPDHLARTIPVILQAISTRPASQTPMQQNAPATFGEIAIPSGIRTLDAAVPWYVATWFDGLLETLQAGVVGPIAELDTSVHDGGPNLQQLAETATTNVRRYLERADPEFWRSYEGGKVPMARGLQRELQQSFGPVEEAVKRLLLHTEESIRGQERSVAALRSDLAATQDRLKELVARLASLESPFGRMPVGIADLIRLFPLLVIAAVVMVVVSIQKSSLLAVSLWREFCKEDHGVDRARFAAFTDCWYLPPYTGRLLSLMLLGLFTVGVVVGGRAAWLVMSDPQMFVSMAGDFQTAPRALFIALYGLGAVVLVGSTVALRRQLAAQVRDISTTTQGM